MKRRNLDVEMNGRDILAAVAGIALNPRCPQCGGPAQLDTDGRGHVQIIIDHELDCKHATDGQKPRSEA